MSGPGRAGDKRSFALHALKTVRVGLVGAALLGGLSLLALRAGGQVEHQVSDRPRGSFNSGARWQGPGCGGACLCGRCERTVALKFTQTDRGFDDAALRKLCLKPTSCAEIGRVG